MARELPVADAVAHITVTILGEQPEDARYCVSVAGRLSRHDLRRLERACGRAMEYPTPRLELRITGPTDVDPAVRFFLDCLRARGAIIIAPPFPDAG